MMHKISGADGMMYWGEIAIGKAVESNHNLILLIPLEVNRGQSNQVWCKSDDTCDFEPTV